MRAAAGWSGLRSGDGGYAYTIVAFTVISAMFSFRYAGLRRTAGVANHRNAALVGMGSSGASRSRCQSYHYDDCIFYTSVGFVASRKFISRPDALGSELAIPLSGHHRLLQTSVSPPPQSSPRTKKRALDTTAANTPRQAPPFHSGPHRKRGPAVRPAGEFTRSDIH